MSNDALEFKTGMAESQTNVTNVYKSPDREMATAPIITTPIKEDFVVKHLNIVTEHEQETT